MRNGFGTYTYANGDTYEGEWSNKLRHGQGTYTYADSGVKVRYGSLIPRLPRSFVTTLSDGGLGMKPKTRRIGEGLDVDFMHLVIPYFAVSLCLDVSYHVDACLILVLCTHTHTCTRLHAHVHIHMHAHTHTHTCTHT